MDIAIIGTRGIPNHYGGFEQFAQYLAKGLVDKGHSVTVYNSHTHPYQQPSWHGVSIIHKYDPEGKIGTIGQFIYDFNCIADLKKHDYDIILQLGYTSNSIWHKLLPRKSVIITNMDGLEWQRSKYNRMTQYFLRYAEKLAACSSDVLIADSPGIQKHLKTTYGLNSHFIPYGSEVFVNPEEDVLQEYHLSKYQYNLVIARMEPENNIETIIKGHIVTRPSPELILIGNFNNNFGTYLKKKYKSPKIRFIGAIYDIKILNNLRYFSNVYFHGHSVGGTNPSLLEAMAANCLICAHDNIFNRSILGQDAVYFQNEEDIKNYLEKNTAKSGFGKEITNNLNKIRKEYSWPSVINQYESLFKQALT